MHCGGGKAKAAIELARSLLASLREEFERLPPFHRQCAKTAHGVATALLGFLVNNRKDLVDYQCERMKGASNLIGIGGVRDEPCGK